MSLMPFELTDQIRRHLTDDTLAWLTTVSPTGRPAPRLVWFHWTGDEVVIYSAPGAAKLTHLAGNDRVSLNFSADAHGGDAVVLAGRAEPAPELPAAEVLPGLAEKYAALLAAIGMSLEHFSTTYSVPIRLTLDRAWTIPA